MAQNTVTFSDDPSGDELLDQKLTPLQENIETTNGGTSRPAYAQRGTLWVDWTTDPVVLNYFDGTDDIALASIDEASNTVILSGSALAAGSVTNAKLANMAQATFKGRAAAAGTGSPTDLTAAQASTILTDSALGQDMVYDRANVLGTVSFSSSQNTGAIIEAGSNANGYWTKWADGTMECRGSGSVDVSSATTNTFGSTSGTSYFSNAVVTMPQAFAGTTAGLMNPTATATTTGMALVAFTTSTTTITVNCRHATNGQTVPFTWCVRGRWRA